MSLRILSHYPLHWRNGTSWIGRTCCAVIGEPRYDAIRVWKRTLYAEWWYMKQTYLHWFYVNKSDWANFLSILPKPDSSHGFPWKETPSRYSQFSEDNFNSDGYVGWYTYAWVALAAIWNAYIYFWPRRWINSFDMLSENNAERMMYVDSFAMATYDQSATYWWNFWGYFFTPHKFHWFRRNSSWQFDPDSKIRPITLTLNRKNVVYDHHWKGVGMETSMAY